MATRKPIFTKEYHFYVIPASYFRISCKITAVPKSDGIYEM